MKIFKILTLIFCINQNFAVHAMCTFGELQEVPDSPFSSQATSPQSTEFSPLLSGGLFAATALFLRRVAVFSVDQTTGAFTPVAGSPFLLLNLGSRPQDIAFSPITTVNTVFVATANSATNDTTIFSVNQTTGVLTRIDPPTPVGLNPFSVAFSPITSAGALIEAVANHFDNTVSVFLVDQTTGALTEVAGSPFATGINPIDIAFSPEVSGGVFAAVANSGESTVSVFSVNLATGVFSPVAGSPFATGSTPNAVAFSPVVNGNLFAAVANPLSNDISVYSVNTTTGAFTQIGAPVPADTPVSIAFSPDVNGHLFAMTSNQIDAVSIFEVNESTGVFTFVDTASADGGPISVAFSPVVSNNLFAATSNESTNNISVYS